MRPRHWRSPRTLEIFTARPDWLPMRWPLHASVSPMNPSPVALLLADVLAPPASTLCSLPFTPPKSSSKR